MAVMAPALRVSVYPRGYGEREYSADDNFREYGLSPWVRGTLAWRLCVFIQRRFIPVGTGNASNGTSDTPTHAVYPRGYGERRYQFFLAFLQFGLSPWVRGTHTPWPLLCFV